MTSKPNCRIANARYWVGPFTLFLVFVLQGCGSISRAPGPDALEADLRVAITQVQQIADTGDQGAILDTLSTDIQVSFGVEGSGHDAFLRLWRDDGSAQLFGRYAAVLREAFSQGGAHLPDGAVQFPWWTHGIPDPQADPDRLAFLSDPASARIGLGADAPLMGLSEPQIVVCNRTLCRAREGSDRVAFRTLDGRTGYVPTGVMQSVLRAQRAIMERVEGRWKLVALIIGD